MLYYIIVYIYYIYIYTQIVGWSIHFSPGRSCQAEPGGFQISDGPGAAFCFFFFAGQGVRREGLKFAGDFF